MKKIAIALCLAALAAAAFAAGNKPTIIKIATGIADTHPTYKGCEEFARLLNAKAPGRFDVKIYGNAQLGDDVRVTEQVQMGLLEMCTTSSSPIVGMVPKFQVLDLPFLFSNAKSTDAVMDGPVGAELTAALAAKNVKVVSYFDGGFRQLTNSKKAVRSPADLKGLKIRTMENQIHLAAWKALGANPSPMPFSEVFTALQQGTIDGQENPTSIVVSQKFYEVQKFVTLTSHVWQPHMILMSMKLYNALSAEDKKAVDDAGKEATVYQRALTRKMEADYLATLKAAKLTVIELTPQESKAFQAGVQSVYDQFSDKIGKDFIERVKAAANAAN